MGWLLALIQTIAMLLGSSIIIWHVLATWAAVWMGLPYTGAEMWQVYTGPFTRNGPVLNSIVIASTAYVYMLMIRGLYRMRSTT